MKQAKAVVPVIIVTLLIWGQAYARDCNHDVDLSNTVWKGRFYAGKTVGGLIMDIEGVNDDCSIKGTYTATSNARNFGHNPKELIETNLEGRIFSFVAIGNDGNRAETTLKIDRKGTKMSGKTSYRKNNNIRYVLKKQ